MLPEEGDETSDALLDAIVESGAAAPALWPLEVADILLVKERRGTLTFKTRTAAYRVLRDLPVEIDGQTVARAWSDTFSIAIRHGLTVYDASYLELAIRLGLPLASHDRSLRNAAASCGVPVV